MPEDNKLVTKEYLMERYNLTEADLEGIDIDFVLKNVKWTITSFEKENQKLEGLDNKEMTILFLKLAESQLKEKIEKDEWLSKNSKAYLLNAEENKAEIPDLNTIKYISTNSEHEYGIHSYFVDFEKNMIYKAGGSVTVTEDSSIAEKNRELSDSQKQTIIECLTNCKITVWSTMLKKQSKDSDTFRKTIIEFNDGSIFVFDLMNATDELWECNDELVHTLNKVIIGNIK